MSVVRSSSSTGLPTAIGSMAQGPEGYGIAVEPAVIQAALEESR